MLTSLTGLPTASGFLAGGYLPTGAANDPAPDCNNVVFDYPASTGSYVPRGEHTVVFYLISPNAPDIDGTALVTDSGVAAASAVVAAPEPASIGLLVMGATGLILRRRRHTTR
jgi:hypothetical protein